MKLPTAAHHRFVGHDTASSLPFGCGGTAAVWPTHEAAAALGTKTPSSATAATTNDLKVAALINIRSQLMDRWSITCQRTTRKSDSPKTRSRRTVSARLQVLDTS